MGSSDGLAAVARLLVILGSGETAPSMTATHRAVLDRLPAPADARLLDTTYGFQENADEITDRIRRYFRDQVGTPVTPVSLRGPDPDPVEVAQAARAVRHADWVFAGPGSPSYAVRHLRDTPVPDALRAVLRTGGAVVLASAAACTLGPLTAPVYELYKAGDDPHWVPGLDLLAEAGLDAVVLPHFDNTEGGTHDTRFCYLGERRLALMEGLLPDGVWVLGVDEHTAAVIDLDADTITVRGRGSVTVRTPAGLTPFAAGETVPLDRVRAIARDGAGPKAALPPTPPAFPTPAAELEERFAQALGAGDATTAVAIALKVEDLVAAAPAEPARDHARRVLRSMLVDLAATAQDGLHEHRRLVAPFVAAVLQWRADARERGDFALSDQLRERLATGGVDVHDTPDGPAWTYHEPRTRP